MLGNVYNSKMKRFYGGWFRSYYNDSVRKEHQDEITVLDRS